MPRWTIHNPTASSINLPYPLQGKVQPRRSFVLDTQAVNIDTPEMQALIRKGLLRVDVVIEDAATDNKIEVPVLSLVQQSGALEFKGSWSSVSAYVANDVVKHAGQSWVALAPNGNSEPQAGSLDWTPLSESVVWRGTWSALTSYNTLDLVQHTGQSWIALTDNLGATPADGSVDWVQLSDSMVWRGTWGSGTQYQTNDVVFYTDRTWVALTPSLNVTPVAGPNWSPFFTGTAGSGITEPQHEVLDTLTHELAETAYTENTYTSGKLTQVIVWTSVAKLIKIRQSVFTYTGANLTTSVTTQHNGAGAVIATLTKVFSYASGNLVNIQTTRT